LLEGSQGAQQLLQGLPVSGDVQIHCAIAAEAPMTIRDQGDGLLAKEVAVQVTRTEVARAVGIAVLPIHLGGPPLTLGPGQ
jgi:hypothetical protein